MRRLDLPTLHAAWWAFWAAHAARRQLRRGTPLERLALPPVPELPRAAGRGVSAALRRTRHNCLVSAAVRQTWNAAHGEQRVLIIGVTAPSAGFHAHAWLEGDPPCPGETFQELTRHPRQ